MEIRAQSEKGIELVNIEFKGNNNFSDSDLLSVIQSQESPGWVYKFLNSFTPLGSPPVYFDSTSISIDIISLTSFYVVNGFFTSKFSYTYDIDSVSREATLTYIIDERPYCTYGSVSVKGLEYLDSFLQSRVSGFFEFPKLKRFTQELVDERMNAVVAELKNNGFKFIKFDSTMISIDTVHYKTNLTSYFSLGNLYTYNEIKIEKEGEGKDLVDDELLKYVADINIGDIYNEAVLAKSRLRLARTSLFSTVNVKGDETDTVGSKIPLLIKGNIGPLNEVSPEVFVDNELNTFNAGVGASYVRKNFLGDARKLTLRTRFRVNDITNITFTSQEFDETFQTEIDLSMILEQPFLFSRRVSGRLETFIKSYTISTVDYQNYGAVLTSSIDMPSYTFINLINPYFRFDRLAYEFPFIYNTPPDTVNTKTRTFTTSLGVETGSTNTNDIFFPTSGRTISLISEVSSSDVTWNFANEIQDTTVFRINDKGYYYKLQLTIGLFEALSKDKNTVLGIKAKAGFIEMISGGQELVSPNQTFFAGGSNSVRGWRARELIPENRIEYIGSPNLNDELRIRGGTVILEGSFEYRRRFKNDLGFAVFVDYGNTWNNFSDFRWDGVALAIGSGLRYYSPIAPFRIDFGFKLYDPFTGKFITEQAVFKTMEFHFGIGEAF